MKLNEVAFANAFTLVFEALYVLCRVLSLVMPDLLFSIGRSWFHTFSMDSTKIYTTLDLGTFVLGGVTLGVLSWVTFYLGSMFYNKLARK